MGQRGRVVHVRGSGGAALLDGASAPCVLLATNRRWTSFVPLAELDEAAFAAAVGAPVVHVWFDDDAGVVLQIAAPDGFHGELAVPRREETGVGAEDRRFIAELVLRNVLTAATARDLEARLAAAILATTWAAEDWGAVIRSPKVDDSGTDPDEARRWRQMTGREPTS